MTKEESTLLLVEKTKAGDQEAFDQLVKRFQPRLMDQIRMRMGSYVRSKLEVEDVLNETYACVSSSIDKFRWQGEASFFSWLSSIAEHLIRNASRIKSWNHLGLERDVTSDNAPPSKDLRREDRFDRLEKALENLEPDLRKALMMARIDGLKVKEIAKRMNRSPDGVKKLLARALLQMKRLFGDTESLSLPQREFKIEKDDEDDGQNK
jgi:RNA polymerase sigma-70 factor (ECF subfamily)